MKLFVSGHDTKAIGGGFSFTRNFVKAIKKMDVWLVDSFIDADVVFITGPTNMERKDVEWCRAHNKAIVLRADNIPEDYRNRGTAISRLKDFSRMADVVVYQSKWALEYVSGLTGVDGTVILNGVDTDVFNAPARDPAIKNRYLYVRSSTNENKRWQEAKYYFRMEWLKNPDAFLTIVGNFGDYVKLYSIDFSNIYKLGLFDEPFQFLGQIQDAELMAEIYRQNNYLLAPYFNDACSNCVCEAIACGVDIMPCLSGMTGGTPELLSRPRDFIGLDHMAKQYYGLFELALSI